MQPNELKDLGYLVPLSSNLNPSFSSVAQNTINPYQMARYSYLFSNLQINAPQFTEVSPNPSCFSSNSTSDEADEQQLSIINEKKQRRMISNRESARRSRMRKQRHVDELWSQVVWLRNENYHLIDKLNRVLESHDRVLKENEHLKEEALELRQKLTDWQLRRPYSPLRDLEEIANWTYLGNDHDSSN